MTAAAPTALDRKESPKSRSRHVRGELGGQHCDVQRLDVAESRHNVYAIVFQHQPLQAGARQAHSDVSDTRV
jgi:hypothetical protein